MSLAPTPLSLWATATRLFVKRGALHAGDVVVGEVPRHGVGDAARWRALEGGGEDARAVGPAGDAEAALVAEPLVARPCKALAATSGCPLYEDLPAC